MVYFLTSWRTFWRHGVLHSIMTYGLKSWRNFHSLWRHDVFLNIIKYFLTSWHTLYFWHYDILFNFMTYFTTLWHTFWCHDIIFNAKLYLLTSWRTFHTYWRYGVLFDVMAYLWRTLWRHCVAFEVMMFVFTLPRTFDFQTYLLTLWRTFLCLDVFLKSWHTSWRHHLLWHHAIISVLYGVMPYVITYYWLYDICFDPGGLTYFPYLLMSWCTGWSNDVLSIPFDGTMYWMKQWRTYDILLMPGSRSPEMWQSHNRRHLRNGTSHK